MTRKSRRPRPASASCRKHFRLNLEVLEDRLAPATFTVLNTNDSGAGSLRQAILNANSTVVQDRIEFNIAGAGVHTIAPTSALPTIEQPLIIDGYTQPGSSPNTNGPGLGDNAVLRIELNGSGAGTSVNGLEFNLPSNTEGSMVRGLAINRFGSLIFGGAGVAIGGRSTVQVQGNFIGTDASGTLARGNGGSGVSVGGAGNTIGGSAPAMRNVISGNGGAGIDFSNNGGFAGESSAGNDVQNNFIGTDATGTVALGNQLGIGVGSHNTRIGGSSAAERNVISGNTFDGIFITDGGQGTGNGNVVRGNFIGTQVDGAGRLGNGREGVSVDFGGTSNTIGGTTNGAGNIIAFNAAFGVNLSRTAGVSILGNSIFANGRLGISLGSAAPIANDLGDADAGANNQQNFPVLTSVVSSGGSTTIQGTLNSLANNTFLLQFFANDLPDGSSHGEGQRLIGELTVATPQNSNDAPINIVLPVALAPTQFVSATATLMADHDANPATPLVARDTSEFSEVRADLALAMTASADAVFVGQEFTYTLVVTNVGPFPAVNVTVVDTLPANNSFVSATTEQGAFSVAGQIVTFNVGTLAVGASVTATVVVRANAPGSLANTATINVNIVHDPNLANNSQAATTRVDPRPTTDVAVVKTASAPAVTAGGALTYTIVVSNQGAGAAVNLTLSDVLPAATTFVLLATPPGWTAQTPAVGSTGSVLATFGSLATQSTATFELVVRVLSNVAGETSNIAQIATVSIDTNPDNNSSTATVSVTAPPPPLPAPPLTLPPAVQKASLTITLVGRNASFRNEMGLFLVDDASGRIGKLRPGDVGYTAAALARRRVLFTRFDRVGAVRKLSLPANSHFELYLVQNGSSAEVMARGRGSRLNRPRVFFANQRANSDGFQHTRWLSATRIAFEDQTNGGDRDFNDLVANFQIRGSSTMRRLS